NFMTIDEVVNFSMTTCKGATSEDRLLFRVWCVAAMRDLGVNKDWVKIATLPVKDFTIEKPSDMVSTIKIALYDIDGNEIAHKFRSGSKKISTDRFSVNQEFNTVDLS